jgi:transposase-like protein
MNLLEFQERFATEEDCIAYLIEQRWPDGYVCEGCGGTEVGYHTGHCRFQCKYCKRQKSVTAGTMFHRSQTSLKEWFLAIYLMSQSKKGISSLELQQHLGAKDERRMAHMQSLIRQAMGSRENQYRLTGFVHADDALFGGKSNRREGKSGFENKVRVQVTLSIDEKTDKPKYLKMKVMSDGEKETTSQTIKQSVLAGSTVWSDGGTNFQKLPLEGYKHVGFVIQDPCDCETHFKWLNTVIANAKRFILGTHHSVSADKLQQYLDEFCYRFNRRFFGSEIFPRTMMVAIAFLPFYLRP